ncbi:hypothetical protein WJX73_004516 [Symbiochloris irregularis]|uniref:RNA helicase n=1 Tax=Symbiochloris irregularis TaxID=706552 RepID=A0AAW1P9S6_9CHLO
MSSSGQKRQFPYHSSVPTVEVKRRGVDGFHPGQAHTNDQATVHSFPQLTSEPSPTSTNFAAWSEAQINSFLDQRGEDYDDCHTFQALVQRAQKCEYETGHAPAPGQAQAEEEVDPLEAFMADINQEVKEDKPPHQAKPAQKLDVDEEDHVADFMEARRRNKMSAAHAAIVTHAGGTGNEDDEVYAVAKAMDDAQNAGLDDDDDDDGYDNAPAAGGKQKIDPLAALDHASIQYDEFAKDFYEEAAEVTKMSHAEVNTLRRQLGVRIAGFDPPRPVHTFAQLGLDGALLAAIKRAGFDKPTAIQAQAIPAALSGRDVLGIAKTGSGKTAAFVLPMLVHIMDQPELEKGTGPIGVIVAPTRELSEQIHKEARKFSKPYNLRVAAAFGGLSKYEQFKDLKGGSEVAVCTPGRMIDLIKMKACTMHRTTFLVFDEADRMFDMGFEPQVRSILGQVRPDRQTLLFSATMPNKVENLVRDALTSPVRVTVGEIGAANEDIRQVTCVVEEAAKHEWLTQRLQGFIDQGDVLVFAGQKLRVDELTDKLKAAGFRAAAIHGDMDQHARMSALAAFKAGTHHVLVATDIAARGLDIKSIKSVVNYDTAKDIDTHVHRVGRTGRAGDREGVAYTLITPREVKFAGDLVESLTAANQEVSAELLALANKDPKFKRGQGLRGQRGGGRGGRGRGRRQVGGAGLGFGEGPPPPDGQSLNQPQQQQQQQQASQGGVWGSGTKSAFASRYKTAFVASGTSGGDIGQKATIVAPRQQSNRAVPPPPMPLAARPSFAPPAYVGTSAPSPGAGAAAAGSQALAAAQAIAARISASHGGVTPQASAQPSATPLHPFAPPPSLTQPSTRQQQAHVG